MKKRKLLALFCLLLGGGPLAAAGPALTPMVPALAPDAASRIGSVAAVTGIVEIASSGKVGRVVESGAPVFLGDQVSTGPEGQLQILLRDETIFTIGPNSAITIDQFVYDPATQDGEVQATIAKGVFRFITGRIAKKKPENMRVKLPVGTIGVRGTIVAGEVIGKQSTIVLMGPGDQTSSDAKIGSFVLENPVKNPRTDKIEIKETHVVRSGFASKIEGDNAPPTNAFKAPPVFIQRLTDSFSGTGEIQREGGGEGPAGENPRNKPANQGGENKGRGEPGPRQETGENKRPGGGPNGPDAPDSKNQPGPFRLPGDFKTEGPGEITRFEGGDFFKGGDFSDVTREAALDIIKETQIGEVPDDAATKLQLRSIDTLSDSGIAASLEFHFEELNAMTTDTSTEYNVSIDFIPDADSRTIGGGQSFVSDNGNTGIGDFVFNLSTAKSFDTGTGTGPAGFTFQDIANSATGGAECGGCHADVFIGLKNASADVKAGDGVENIATKAIIIVAIKDGAGATANSLAATKTVVDIDREQGLTS